MTPDTSNGKWDTPLTELSEVHCISRYHLYTSRKAPRAHTLHKALITHIKASPILYIQYIILYKDEAELITGILFAFYTMYLIYVNTYAIDLKNIYIAHLLSMGLTDHALQWIRIHMTFLPFLVHPYFTLEILTLWTTNYSDVATSEP